MNAVEQYNANNVYYAFDVSDCSTLSGIYFLASDNNIYKTKCQWGDGTSDNATFGEFIRTKVYAPRFTGKLKIHNNPAKIKEINLAIGISGGGSDLNLLLPRNIELNPTILDFFPNCESLYFSHYAYGINHPNLKGRVTGEWAIKCGSKLKSLQLVNCDYPASDPTFNLNLIPNDSVLESLYLGSGYSASNGYVSVSGNLDHLPATCKIVYLGGDKSATSTTNSVSGVIPGWVTSFSRTGRNDIAGDIMYLSNDLQYFQLMGANVMKGNLKDFPSCTTFNVQGNNEIGGTIKSMPLCTNLSIAGSNTISGILPFLPKISTINIAGNNSLSGTIPTMPTLTSLIIGGSNKISAIENQPNCATVQVASAYHTISGNFLQNFPKATTVTLSGKDAPITYPTTGRSWPTLMSRVNIRASETLDTTQVNRLLIDLAATTWTGSSNVVIISGNSGARNQDADNAVAILTGKNVTIVTNK